MEKPEYYQVQQDFLKKLGDAEVAHLCAKRFCVYNENNCGADGEWMVKIGKKRTPMKNWQLAVNTFVRNMPKYSKDLVVKLERNKIFKNG